MWSKILVLRAPPAAEAMLGLAGFDGFDGFDGGDAGPTRLWPSRVAGPTRAAAAAAAATAAAFGVEAGLPFCMTEADFSLSFLFFLWMTRSPG